MKILTPQRLDIQALRGLAVLLVVFYHTKIGGLAGGYLGVDMFFVISGFLITRLVAGAMARGDFSFKAFYFRRAKRLLPAAFVTFLITAALAPWFLNQHELRDFAAQLVGALTFTANIVLWTQTGYFEGASDLKPLLHIWSLAIEEQYYFVLPSLLWLTPRRHWLALVTGLLVLSLALCVGVGIVKPVAAFYLLPTRAWELLIGSIGALWLTRTDSRGQALVASGCALLFVPALVCLVALPCFPLPGMHPGLNALVICCATLVVILRASERLNGALATRALAHVGDYSYSLYLVHWPIIAFMKNAWTGSDPVVSLPWRVATLLLSLVAGYALYRLVEAPIRRRSALPSIALLMKAGLASVLLAAFIPLFVALRPAAVDFNTLRRSNYGLAAACEYTGDFVPKAACRTSDKPDLLVWGDSYAMHLVPGLAQAWKQGGIVQATKSQCGPFLGMAPKTVAGPKDEVIKDMAWARGCIAFNQSVIDYVRATASLKYVVLSSPFSQYISADNMEHVLEVNKELIVAPATVDNAVASLDRTINAIRAAGKSVILVAPPPSSGFDIGACLERQLSGAVTVGAGPGCMVKRAEYESRRAPVLSFLKHVQADTQVSLIRFDPWLCDPVNCNTMIDGTMIYRDAGHLSYAGSVLIVERMQLAKAIAATARR